MDFSNLFTSDTMSLWIAKLQNMLMKFAQQPGETVIGIACLCIGIYMFTRYELPFKIMGAAFTFATLLTIYNVILK